MIGGRSTGHMILLLVCDLLLTPAALYMASMAQRNIPLGMDLGPERFVYLLVEVYLIVAVPWAFLSVLLSLYDAGRTSSLADELERVILAVVMGTLVLAGTLYLSFRDVSRLLFIYFFIFDLSARVDFRLFMRRVFRIAGGKTDGTTKVLVIGAQKTGWEVARMITRLEWSGVQGTGCLDDDPRITRVWRMLRHASVHELPHLLNAIKGEKSLVDLRPEVPFLVEEYQPWQRQRFALPLAMTGWWQISDGSDKPVHPRVEEDLYYIQNYSLLQDVVEDLGVCLKDAVHTELLLAEPENSGEALST